MMAPSPMSLDRAGARVASQQSPILRHGAYRVASRGGGCKRYGADGPWKTSKGLWKPRHLRGRWFSA